MIYKIKNADGLFSAGGQRPSFTKKGKIWPSKGGVMLHLSLVAGNSPEVSGIPLKVSKLYGDCTVIEIDDAIGGLTEIDFTTWYNANRSKRK